VYYIDNERKRVILMKLNEKLILVDCDGVLVDWVYAFDEFMKRHGYKKLHEDTYDLHICYGIEKSECKKLVRVFNESAAVEYIPPLRDAIKYVKKIHEEMGYVFHCITSLSLDPFAAKARERNIKALFGDTAFEKIVCLDTGADKDEALEPYRDSGCLWVEDKTENAVVGFEMGLNAILIAHIHNEDYEGPIERVENWKEIYHNLV
jgi:hypothetical protein